MTQQRLQYVITGLNVGGAERLVTSFADHFAESGYDVEVVVLVDTPKMLPSSNRVRVVPLHGRRGVLGLPRLFLSLVRAIRRFRPQVVHSHLFHANIMCRVARILTRIPTLISSAHNKNEEGRFRMLAYRLTDFLTNVTTNVSAEASEAFVLAKAVPKHRIVTIYNGIDTGEFLFNASRREKIREELGLPNDAHLVLAVGRLWEQKDYPNLLMAFSRLPDRLTTLAIVGDGPLDSSLKTLATDLGISERVSFLGVRNDIPSLMSASDVFALSSAWEGFGLVVAEAMACERLVVATDCGGVAEVVGECGLLVPPRDTQSLTKALAAALAMDEASRRELTMSARARVVEQFSLTSCLNEYGELYSRSCVFNKPKN